MRRVTLVFDGGSIGNPGPCYGSYLIRGAGLERRGPMRVTLQDGTNNEAEYRTLLLGLESLLRRLKEKEVPPREVNLQILGDSSLVINQLAGEWKARNARMRRLRDRALVLLKQFGAVECKHQDRWRSVEILGH
jgi:ribonuclease HI